MIGVIASLIGVIAAALTERYGFESHGHQPCMQVLTTAPLPHRYGFDLMATVFAGWCALAVLALGASGWRGGKSCGKASAIAGVSTGINEANVPPITPINEAITPINEVITPINGGR